MANNLKNRKNQREILQLLYICLPEIHNLTENLGNPGNSKKKANHSYIFAILWNNYFNQIMAEKRGIYGKRTRSFFEEIR